MIYENKSSSVLPIDILATCRYMILLSCLSQQWQFETPAASLDLQVMENFTTCPGGWGVGGDRFVGAGLAQTN